MYRGSHRTLRILASSSVFPRATASSTCSNTRIPSRFVHDQKSDDNNPSSVDPRLTEWIPPDRPLVGDKGYNHLYKRNDGAVEEEDEDLEEFEREIQLLEEETKLSEEEQLKRIQQELERLDEKAAKKKKKKPTVVQPQQTLDWMKTRRETLGSNTLTPSFGRPKQDLHVLEHTLLSSTEIMDLLSSLGGIDVRLIHDQVMNEHGDTRLGGAARGIVFATGSSSAHIRMLASSLVEQLKLRKLHQVGVVGARHGAEGMDDEDANWIAVDCKNYIVHIQDATTRKAMDLESWWSQADPLAEYNLQGTDRDEDAIDDFIAKNPIPDNYGKGSAESWMDTLNKLENKRWTAPHKTVVPKPTTGRRRKKKGKIRSRDKA